MNAEWEKLQGEDGSRLVTGVTVVRNEFLQEHENAVATFMEEHQASAQSMNSDVENGAKLAVASEIIAKEPIALKAIPKCNITYIDGADMKQALSGYLEVLYEQNPESICGALPGDDFYYVPQKYIILGWIFAWQVLSWLVNNPILLAGPLETGKALLDNIVMPSFWKTVSYSLLRIAAGFFAGVGVGLVLACASARFSIIEEIFSPVLSLIKAVPVASFVVLFLIWWHSDMLSTAISFCVVHSQHRSQTSGNGTGIQMESTGQIFLYISSGSEAFS